MLAEEILLLIIGIIISLLFIIAKRWDKLNFFFHRRYTFINIVFITLYFIEQAIFITSSYLYPEHIGLLVGFFALVVLTTVALQGVMMESKSKRLSERLDEANKLSMEKISEVRNEYEIKPL